MRNGLGLGLVDAALRWRGAAMFSFTGGTLPGGATLTRGSAARRTNAAGLIESVAANGARFEHDPLTLALRGLLIEPAASNGVASSQAFANSYWTRRGSFTATDNAIAAPDGTTTAAAWSGIAATTTGDMYDPAYGTAGRFPNSAVCVPSFWIRPVSGTGTLLVQNASNGTAGGGMTINLALLTAGIWTRVYPGHAAASMINPFVSSATGALGVDIACTAGAPVSGHFWGVQLEAGATMTSHIPTTTGTATRAADVLTLNWASRGVPDGNVTLRYGFDDGSTQDVAATISGGVAAVPTNLNRAIIRTVTRL